MRTAVLTAVALLAMAVAPRASINRDETERLAKAAHVVQAVNQTIPADLWTRARCVAVIPDVKKAAFIFGGEYGKGVMSCRTADGWSAPVFLQLAKGSWGFQVGAEQVDLILLVMNESGVQKLLKNKVSLGADASVAAGPVGRQGHVGTDAQLTAEILSYSRAQGLFAGIDLSGGVLRPDEDANRDVYGHDASPRIILASRGLSAPTAATGFLDALAAQPAATEASASPARPGSGVRGEVVPPPPAQQRQDDEELRSRITDMRATLDRILDNATPVPPGMTITQGAVGTTGTSTPTNAGVIVDRTQLLKLRQQLDSLVLALNARR